MMMKPQEKDKMEKDDELELEEEREETEEEIEAYNRAISDLNSHASAHGSVAIPRTDPSSPTVRAVKACLEALGLDDAALAALRVVHVTGTKGKGSTAALVAAALGASGVPRVGLYTSPHLRDVRERIRVSGRAIGRGAFARCYARVTTACPPPALAALGYFPLLTVLALAHFARARCGAVVLEVGVGGRTDATNVVARPAVCAVAALGLDHTAALGATVADIAWEKAGIFRPGVPALAAPHQPAAALAVLRARAAEFGTVLTVAGEDEGDGDGSAASTAVLTEAAGAHMHGAFQRTNAVLAAAAVRAWWAQHGAALEAGGARLRIAEGFRACVWPGRAQTLVRGACTLHIDGAHTPESLAACVEWFAQCLRARPVGTDAAGNALVFACKGDRAPDVLLTALADACAANGVTFTRVVCVQLQPCAAFHSASTLCDAARTHLPACREVTPAGSAQDALALCADTPAVLVTGSLYLVSEVLAAADYNTTDPLWPSKL